LDVEGHTELDNVNVSGVSTFVGIVTSQSDVFVGNNLSVAGDARIVGVLTVGSASVTLNGDTNTITVGHGVTIHTTTASVNQLEVSGLSTFTGIGTFRSDLYVGGTLYTPDLVVDGSSVGNDITTRNISASGIVTVTGNTDLNGDLDVDGHTELDNLNVSGVSTFVGVSTFQDNVVFDSTGSIQVPKGDTSQRPTGVLGQIRYNIEQSTFEGFGAGNAWGSLGGVKDVNQDTYIIPELSAGSNEDTLYFYNAGSNTATISSTTATVNVDFAVTGVSTFTGNIDANGNLDVDGHTELDNVRISGFLTATSAEFSGNVTVLGDLTYENVTNVDAIGIATARSGLRITGGGLDVTGIATFNDGANVASGNTYKVNGVDVLSATTLGSNVVNSSLTSLGAGVISNRTELTIGQPSGGDYILLYDADAGDLKKATISNAALQGVQGIQGVQGTQGIQGTQGVQGIQGVQGTQGIQGTQGVQGTFGTQGTQGIQGIEAPTTFTISSKSSAYQLVLLDSGKLISITTGGVTVPSGTFSGGESVMIYNNSASSQTITQGSGMTLRLPGTADTGNRTLQQRGIVTVLFLSSSEALISGSGLL
jgi:cytoskeletal protein CcmA (bactofilin family)